MTTTNQKAPLIKPLVGSQHLLPNVIDSLVPLNFVIERIVSRIFKDLSSLSET